MAHNLSSGIPGFYLILVFRLLLHTMFLNPRPRLRRLMATLLMAEAGCLCNGRASYYSSLVFLC